MTHDDSLRERYADLLGPDPDDPALARLLTALDARYAAEPPAGLAAALDRAVRDRAHAPALPSPPQRLSPARTHHDLAVVHHQEGAAPMPARRLPVILGGLAAVLIVGLMAALLVTLGGRGATGLSGDGETPQQRFARLGGLEVVLHVNRCLSTPSHPTDCYTNGPLPAAMPAAMLDAVRHRAVVALGVSDPVVQQTGDDTITVDLPGYTDKRGPALLDQAGELDFLDTGAAQLRVGDDVGGQVCASQCLAGQPYKILFTGAQLDPASLAAQNAPNTGRAVVNFAFKGDAKAQFAQYTRDHIGQYLTIALDGKIIESTTIQSAIDGPATIGGLDTPDSAQQLVAILKAGAYPLPVSLDHTELAAPGTSAVHPCSTATPAPPVTPTAPGADPTSTPTPAPYDPNAATPTPAPYTPGQTATPAPELCATPTPAPGVDGSATPTVTPPPTPSPVAHP